MVGLHVKLSMSGNVENVVLKCRFGELVKCTLPTAWRDSRRCINMPYASLQSLRMAVNRPQTIQLASPIRQ